MCEIRALLIKKTVRRYYSMFLAAGEYRRQGEIGCTLIVSCLIA
jgi:hypothetical protein